MDSSTEKIIDFFPINNHFVAKFNKNIDKENDKEKDKEKGKENDKEKDVVGFWSKWGNIILIVGSLIVIPALLFLSIKHPYIKSKLLEFITYLRSNDTISSYSIFIMFIVFMSLVTSNTTIPNLISGMVYGTFKGSIITSIGILISGSISFFISRYLLRDKLTKIIKNNPLLKKYYNLIIKSEDKLTDENLLEIVFLSRLAPISPFHTFSYFWGISDVKFWGFLVGTLGIIPSLVFETYLGSQLDNVNEIFHNKTKIFHLVIIIIISISIGWITEKLINKMLMKKVNTKTKNLKS